MMRINADANPYTQHCVGISTLMLIWNESMSEETGTPWDMKSGWSVRLIRMLKGRLNIATEPVCNKKSSFKLTKKFSTKMPTLLHLYSVNCWILVSRRNTLRNIPYLMLSTAHN
jgi:hypothetical protein